MTVAPAAGRQRYPYQKSAQALYWPAHGPPFFEHWDQQRDTGDADLLCAELSRLAYADQQTARDNLRKIDFSLPLWIGGETAEQRGATHGTDGFIAASQDGRLTVLAFRGTESNKPEDILTDALATSEPWNPPDPDGGHVHRGFARVYALVRDRIHRTLAGTAGDLLITGHSLGAGLATLAAADLASRHPALITFGSPRVGDDQFAHRLAGLKVRRFVDCCDLVTRVPPERFDEPEIEKLLLELIPARLLPTDRRAHAIVTGLIKVVASALATALRGLDVQPQYEHVGEAIYRDRAGKELPSATADAIETDQQTARAEYRGSLTPDIKHLLHGLAGAVLSAGLATDAAAIRAAVRDFGARLFQGDPVPLRDLADHAPINYVSLFTGRE